MPPPRHRRPTVVTVVDLHNLNDRAKRFVVGVVLRRAFDEKERTGQPRPLTFVVLDELNKAYGEGGAEAIRRTTKYWEPAYKNSAIVNEAMLGRFEHDLSGYIDKAGVVADAADLDQLAVDGMNAGHQREIDRKEGTSGNQGHLRPLEDPELRGERARPVQGPVVRPGEHALDRLAVRHHGHRVQQELGASAASAVG